MAKKSYIGIADTYLFLDYIQLTGTQYINTGWYANGDTTIELDMYAEITSGVVYYFIGQNGGFGTSSEFVVRKLGSRTYVTSDFGSDQLNASDITATTGRHTIIKAKNTMSFDGVTVTHDITQMTNTQYPSLLLASTTSAGVMTPCPGKIYSCRIYDGETLVRDFVPCKKTSGAIGLYDRVNGTFYANAGSDSFIAGTETGETLALGSVARSVKGYGYVENGINNVVKKIYAEVNGVARLFYQNLPEKDTFQNMSWEDISTVCKAGLASEYWNIGDQKEFVYSTTYQMVFEIIGFDHDTVTDSSAYGRTKAGITVQMHFVSECEYYSSETRAMNSSATNSGGWENSYMRNTIMPLELNRLSSFQDFLVPVNKLTSAGSKSTTIKTTSDTLFLLSEVEVFGTTTYSASGEGTQYEFYANGNSAKKHKESEKYDSSASSTSYNHWLRSPNVANTSYFCYVNTSGNIARASATTKYYEAYAFCI